MIAIGNESNNQKAESTFFFRSQAGKLRDPHYWHAQSNTMEQLLIKSLSQLFKRMGVCAISLADAIFIFYFEAVELDICARDA